METAASDGQILTENLQRYPATICLKWRGKVKNMKISKQIKDIKRWVSVLLTMLLAFTMAHTVLAASGTNNNSGSITIDNAVIGQTYEIYQILELESYDTSQNAYTYKATSAWKTWLEKQTGYVHFDKQGYVTWVGGDNADTVATFAKAALAAAKAQGITPVKKQTAQSTKIEFKDLNLGYYLIDTTLGTLCSLDTTNPDVIMHEKNEQPTVDKEVKEDSDRTWGDENTAQIGDTVEFRTTIAAKKGAQNYVLHDTMTEGLTLLPVSIQVAESTENASRKLVEGEDYTIKLAPQYGGTEGAATTDGCAFELVFAQSYLDGITGNKNIVVSYNAILNEKAVIAVNDDKDKDAANIKRTKMDYGDASETKWDTTKTFTFYFDLVKTDNDKILLNGAEFALYDAQKAGNLIAVVKESDGIYRIATEKEKAVVGFQSATIKAKDGKAVIKGLDADTTYWLEETKQPDGYNKLSERAKVDMGAQNLTAEIEMVGDKNTWIEGGVHVINQKGTELPETGGMGTTLLYLGGSILTLLAAALLLVRRTHR